MTTDRQVIDLLASQLGVRRAFVERTAVFLREAGELGKGEDVEPRDAAALLVALMGVRFPAEAARAVRAYATLPARWGYYEGPGRDGSINAKWVAVEDIRIPPGWGERFNVLTHDFLGALAGFIAQHRDHDLPPSGPEIIQVVANPRAPMAGLRCPDLLNPGGRETWFFTLGDEEDVRYLLAGLRLVHFASAPGSVLKSLGDLLAGRHGNGESGALAADDPAAVEAAAGGR